VLALERLGKRSFTSLPILIIEISTAGWAAGRAAGWLGAKKVELLRQNCREFFKDFLAPKTYPEVLLVGAVFIEKFSFPFLKNGLQFFPYMGVYGTRPPCVDVRMCECANVRMCKCRASRCSDVRMCECADVRMCECADVRMCECANVTDDVTGAAPPMTSQAPSLR
jgi:hypothetical protein